MKSSMTKKLSIIMVLSFASIAANSQKAELGVRLMPTFSTFDLKTSDGSTISGKATIGMGFGAFVGLYFNEYVGVQGEIVYSSLRQKDNTQGNEQEVKLNYVNIPVLLSLNTGKLKSINLNVVAGPQFGINTSSSLSSTSNNGSVSYAVLSVKKGDLGLAFGAGLDFGINPSKSVRLGIGYRGVYGIKDISDKGSTQVSNSYYILDKTKIRTNAAYLGLSVVF